MTDLSKENLKAHSDKYEQHLCEDCKTKLKIKCLPIMNKLNKGQIPFPREMSKLLRVMCGSCTVKIIKEKAKTN